MITASIVLFRTNLDIVYKLVSLLKLTSVSEIYIIDNSDIDMKYRFADNRITYIKSSNNGYGAGHNCALQMVINSSKFHFILNPDVDFDPGIIDAMVARMQSDPIIGIITPKVLYENGDLQYLCKLIPTPLDLIKRRLGFSFGRRKYELRFADYNSEFRLYIASGCFMLLRVDVLKSVGFFDERFFMYMEDFDFSRRVSQCYNIIYYPNATIFHGYAKGSYKNIKLLYYHVVSAIKYFNKWGWLFDRNRRVNNRNTLIWLKKNEKST